VIDVRQDDDYSGTMPVEQRHRLDDVRLGAWMCEHIEDYAGPLTVQQFKGGQSNPTYRLDTPPMCCAASRSANSCHRRTR
jgi:aminoglycoside phosphotransferase (APT) family kinase protein